MLSRTSSVWRSGTPSPVQLLRQDPRCCLISCPSLPKLHLHRLPAARVSCSRCQHSGSGSREPQGQSSPGDTLPLSHKGKETVVDKH